MCTANDGKYSHRKVRGTHLAHNLAAGILSIVMVASPQRVIAGGGVLERPGLRSIVASRLRELVAGYIPTPMLDDRVEEYLVAPALGDRAGVLGAIAMAEALSAAPAHAILPP